jgi:ubiquitin C-terminal hydrolase
MESNTGLNNIGNTCYLNSGLQTLVHCGALSKLILDNKFDDPVLLTYQQFLNDYLTSTKTISPSAIKLMVGIKNKLFMSSGQQDTHEFLISLITILEEAFIKMNEQSDGNMFINNISLNEWISKLFDCNIYSIIKCSVCGYCSNTKEEHRFLSLSINDLSSLDDCFQEYIKPEMLEEKWFCEKCKHKVNAVKSFMINSTPKYLYIHFKRFSYNQKNKAKKIENEIYVPPVWKLNKSNYILKGVVKQSGRINGGHYVSYVKNNDGWFYFNDSSVSKIDEESVLSHAKQSYIVLYGKNN